MRATLQNLSGHEARQWVAMGLPPSMRGHRYAVEAIPERGDPIEGVVEDGLLYVRAHLKPRERMQVEVRQTDQALDYPMIYSNWVTDQWTRNLPRWVVTAPDGTRQVVGSERPQLVDARMRRHTWHLRQVLPGLICLEAWFCIDHDQDAMHWEIRLSYGTTASGPLYGNPGHVSMLVGEKPTIDWRVRKGLHEPVLRTDVVPGQVWWEAELTTRGGSWLRAQTREVQGALLCMPPEQQWASIDKVRAGYLRAREEAPIVGVVEAGVWQGEWGAFGVVPDGVEAGYRERERGRRWDAFLRAYRTPGHALDPRPYAQPPVSGTTGKQPDFGAFRGEDVHDQPWAVHDLRYSAEAWPLRPYANRDPNGRPVVAAEHPSARLYNLRPDERFNRGDMLGWPVPVGFFQYYGTSDNEHRSDNNLVAAWLLTRSKSLERTIRDILACQAMDQFVLGAPRAVGRVLMSLCHMDAAGFDGAEPIIRRIVSAAWEQADYRRRPDTNPVRVYSSNESKYGWTDANGSPIRAWLPWQETIALMGFEAAYRRYELAPARAMAETMAKTITDHGFFEAAGGWHATYGVRWHENGQPPAAEHYRLGGPPNYEVFVFGMQQWMLPAVVLRQRWAPTDARANAILNHYTVADWDDACWRAV